MVFYANFPTGFKLLISKHDQQFKMAEETIYLCNFRVSVDGDWLCLKELSDVQLEVDTLELSSPEDGKRISKYGPQFCSLLICRGGVLHDYMGQIDKYILLT